MIVVSDTTPLNHLILAEYLFILRHLYGKIVIPEEVFLELQSENTPLAVKQAIAAGSDWIEVRKAALCFDEDLETLDPGERAAIMLAEEINAELLLMDEKAGRAAAKSRGINVVGTLGVLKRASELDALDFQTALTRLKSNGFYVSRGLEHFFLRSIEEKEDAGE